MRTRFVPEDGAGIYLSFARVAKWNQEPDDTRRIPPLRAALRA